MQLALDKNTHDLIKKIGGGVERVREGRFVVQQVQSKLLTGLGEWILDDSVGFLKIKDFEKNIDLFEIETRAMETILSTQGVLSIDDIDITFKNRKLHIHFTARTVYGVINNSVKWE